MSTWRCQFRGRDRHRRSGRRALLQPRAMSNRELTVLDVGCGGICHHPRTGRRISGQIRGFFACPTHLEAPVHAQPTRRIPRQPGEAQVHFGGRPFTIRRSFVDDINGQAQEQRIRSLRRQLLVMHSPGDSVVGMDNTRRIFEAALHPKSFVAVDGADHLLTRAADARFAAGMITAWAARYLPIASHSAGVSSNDAAPPPSCA